MLLNSQWMNKDIKRVVTKTPSDKWKQKYNTPNFVECSKSGFKRDGHSNKYLKEKKSLKKPQTLYLKIPVKEQQMKTKVSGRKEGTRIRVDINEVETKKTTKR